MKYTPSLKRYDAMLYRCCGKSGLKLPAISLGLWHNFGDVDDFENAKKMIFRAFDLGITHFDLANNYGPLPGSAEKNFGKILNGHMKTYRDEMVVSTKAGYHMWKGPYGEWGSRKYLLSSLDQSLSRMGLPYVDIFYSHRFDPDTPLEETMGALVSAIQQGKALYAGISNYSASDTARAAKILRSMGVPLLIHQPKYSMMNRWIENGLTDVLQKMGIGCIPFSPLAQGLLTDRYLKGIPRNSRAAKPHGFLKKETVTPEIRAKIRRFGVLAQKRDQTIAETALAWVLRLATTTSVLIGASSAKQIDDNVGALRNISFLAGELAEIDRLFPA